MYGRFIYAAVFEMSENLETIYTTKNSSITSQINDSSRASSTKKNIGQRKLKASCAAYTNRALVLFGLSERKIIAADIPITVYRIVHTTGNSQAGGANGGCASIS